MAAPVLNTRALNRALLARQLLLERSRLPLPRAVEQIGGLQSQYAPSPYLALWSRLAGFRRDMLTDALVRRRLVQGTLMRATIHIVSRRDFPLLAAAVRRGRREWWLRTVTPHLGDVDLDRLAARVRAHLAGGPRRAAELIERLLAEGFPRQAAAQASVAIDLVRVPPSGTWEQRRADLFGLADAWVGTSERSEGAGLVHLVRRYLGAFGPASIDDLVSWSGLPVTTLRPALARVRIRRFRDERGGELLDLPGAPLPAEDMAAPVRFLPAFDAALFVHARRTQILPDRYRARIFGPKLPQSASTFLVDGQVAGTWRHDGKRVRLAPFGRLSRPIRRALDDEAARLAAFHA